MGKKAWGEGIQLGYWEERYREVSGRSSNGRCTKGVSGKGGIEREGVVKGGTQKGVKGRRNQKEAWGFGVKDKYQK
jgi:hypothetical protein